MRFALLALCLVGLWVSFLMQRKALRASRGMLKEPSVVQTARARMLLGVPNSVFGIVYYDLQALATMFLTIPAVYYGALAAAILAAVMSLYLAYSLLFVTKMPCVYCWTGHAVNWALLLVLIFLR